MIRYECECKWMPNSGESHDLNAFVAGFSETDEPMYIARFHHRNDVLPGYHLPSTTASTSSWGGQACESENYEVLIESHDCEFTWLPASYGGIVEGAVRGGKTSSGEILYIGRVKHNGSWKLGKIHRSHQCCYYGLDGKEENNSFYEVLACNLIKHGLTVQRPHYGNYDDDDYYTEDEDDEWE